MIQEAPQRTSTHRHRPFQPEYLSGIHGLSRVNLDFLYCLAPAQSDASRLTPRFRKRVDVRKQKVTTTCRSGLSKHSKHNLRSGN